MNDIDATWSAPRKGHWRRDFRLGEWLPAPVSPSFATCFLPRFEQGFVDASIEAWGVGLQMPLHVLVNGWYFTNTGHATGVVAGFARHPVLWARTVVALGTMTTRPERLEEVQARPALERYDQRDLPAHRRLVEAASSAMASSSASELMDVVDLLSYSTGTLMLAMVEAAGFASKAELALASFYDAHLRSARPGSHLPLVAGLTAPTPPPDHAVYSIDWMEPTVSERERAEPKAIDHDALVAARTAAEEICNRALAGQPKLAARFQTTLAVAQRWVPVRERLVNDFTLAWPVLRAALQHIGADLSARGLIDDPADVYFLERDEMVAAVAGADSSLRDQVVQRRDLRIRQGAAAPPLTIGKPSGNFRLAERAHPRYRSGEPADAPGQLIGLPASAGIATGRVRVVHDFDDFDRFEPGDVLVAPVTAPGWEVLFGLASAVVTDGGSVFAHASVIAREFGIPAVVGTNAATSTLTDGETVVVDGDRGVVERSRESH